MSLKAKLYQLVNICNKNLNLKGHGGLVIFFMIVPIVLIFRIDPITNSL